ncbi:S-adenosyl-L-methionine-dependent methyltransferase [Tribonema minus]|uniref:rRNA adenine N(6)-methyltransferase n=1 Tax=Tribonema minus TaxID=303371 RepID=A0A835YV25_9STRA|nr:S-adenosyl-L-methionine-dependent methyltransferase [Tribonema minus]
MRKKRRRSLSDKPPPGVEGEDFVLIPWTPEQLKSIRAKAKAEADASVSPAVAWQRASKGRNVKLKQSLSQHLLTDQGLLGYVVRQAAVAEGDHVLEIGAGTGNLTQAILDAHKGDISHLTLVELDRDMARKLADRIDAQGYEFTVMEGNDRTPAQSIRFTRAMKASAAVPGGDGARRDVGVDIERCDVLSARLPPFDVLLSNAPYAISRKLLERLVELALAPGYRVAVLMLQEEFVDKLLERLVELALAPGYRAAVLMLQEEFVDKEGFVDKAAARPGHPLYGAPSAAARPGHPLYGAPSVLAQTFLRVEPLRLIGPQNFLPPPKVSSRVVRFTPLGDSAAEARHVFQQTSSSELLVTYRRFLEACFRSRNRKLRGILRDGVTAVPSAPHQPSDEFIRVKVDELISSQGLLEKRPNSTGVREFCTLFVRLHEAGLQLK